MQVRKFPRKILKYPGQHDFRQQIHLQHTRSPHTEIITWHMKSHFENYCVCLTTYRVLKISMWKLIKTPHPFRSFPRSEAIPYSFWWKKGTLLSTLYIYIYYFFLIKYTKCGIPSCSGSHTVLPSRVPLDIHQCCLPGANSAAAYVSKTGLHQLIIGLCI